MDKDIAYNAIAKIIPLIVGDKAEEVHFDINEREPDIWYMDIVYVVADDFLKRGAEDQYYFEDYRLDLNNTIRRSVKGYLGITVRINFRDSRLVKHSDWYK